MIGERVVYFFFYKQYLKLYNDTIWCVAALYVFLNYKQVVKNIA